MNDYIKLLLRIISDFVPNIRRKSLCKASQRQRIDNNLLYVNVHEWGGYRLVRHKHINNKIKDWECGLLYQLERFEKYNGAVNIELSVTISDIHLHDNVDYIRRKCNRLITVSNKGMDFSGYSVFFENIKDKGDAYVILTNSSVNSRHVDFVDSYIKYMQENLDVGMLGISCCSKCYQTLVKNNFTPHLQSFFLLTTIGVLKEVVAVNFNKFPGEGIGNKQLLIRDGEIRLSQLVLGLGYKLAVVTEKGVEKFDNNITNWNLPLGDYRYYTETPNAIKEIKKC